MKKILLICAFTLLPLYAHAAIPVLGGDITIIHANGQKIIYAATTTSDTGRGTALLTALSACTNTDTYILASSTFNIGNRSIDFSCRKTGGINVHGSGKYSTIITSSLTGNPVVTLGNYSELSDLSIVVTGAQGIPFGFYVSNGDLIPAKSTIRNVYTSASFDGLLTLGGGTASQVDIYNWTCSGNFDCVNWSDIGGQLRIYDSDLSVAYSGISTLMRCGTSDSSTIYIYNTTCTITDGTGSHTTYGWDLQGGTLHVAGGTWSTPTNETTSYNFRRVGGTFGVTSNTIYTIASTTGTITHDNQASILNSIAGGYGTSGYLLTSGGNGVQPSWAAPGGSGTVNSGLVGQNAYYAADGTTVSGTSTIFTSTASNVGISSTSPFSKLSVHLNSNDTDLSAFSVGSSTASATTTLFNITNYGNVGVGTTTSIAIRPGLTMNGGLDIAVTSATQLPVHASGGAFRVRAYGASAQARFSLESQSGSGDPVMLMRNENGPADAKAEQIVMRGDSRSYMGLLNDAEGSENTSFSWTRNGQAPLGFQIMNQGLYLGGQTAWATPNFTLDIERPIGSDPSSGISDLDVTTGMTAVMVDTNTFSLMRPISSTAGGTKWENASDADASALNIYGYIGTASPTATTPAMKLMGAKANGTGVQDLASTETILQFANNDNTSAFTLMGSDNAGFGTTTPFSNLSVSSNAQQSAVSSLFAVASTTNTTLFNVLGNGNVGIGTTSPWRTLSSQGTVALNGLTAFATGDSAICQRAGGEISVDSGVSSCIISSRTVKHDITDDSLEVARARISQLNPVMFAYNGTNKEDIGLIAEDVAKIDPRYAQYNPKTGKPQAINWSAITADLIKVVQADKTLEKSSSNYWGLLGLLGLIPLLYRKKNEKI